MEVATAVPEMLREEKDLKEKVFAEENMVATVVKRRSFHLILPNVGSDQIWINMIDTSENIIGKKRPTIITFLICFLSFPMREVGNHSNNKQNFKVKQAYTGWIGCNAIFVQDSTWNSTTICWIISCFKMCIQFYWGEYIIINLKANKDI